MTLTGITSQSQSGSGSIGNELVLHTSHSSITEASLLDAVYYHARTSNFVCVCGESGWVISDVSFGFLGVLGLATSDPLTQMTQLA